MDELPKWLEPTSLWQLVSSLGILFMVAVLLIRGGKIKLGPFEYEGSPLSTRLKNIVDQNAEAIALLKEESEHQRAAGRRLFEKVEKRLDTIDRNQNMHLFWNTHMPEVSRMEAGLAYVLGGGNSDTKKELFKMIKEKKYTYEGIVYYHPELRIDEKLLEEEN